MSNKLDRGFYLHHDVVHIAKNLIGKLLCTYINGVFTSGIISETEAYSGRNDKACHANNNRRTKRTEVMYGPGGHAYVYLCYGIHYLFNVVTNEAQQADAVLIRGIEPVSGIDVILQRRKSKAVHPKLTVGPGSVSQALGITKDHYGTDLTANSIWIEEMAIPDFSIISSTRIGVDYAGDDALLPWRFIKGN